METHFSLYNFDAFESTFQNFERKAGPHTVVVITSLFVNDFRFPKRKKKLTNLNKT
jgi:hypothetical protein